MGLAKWIIMGEGHLRQRDKLLKEAPTQMTDSRGWIKKFQGTEIHEGS